MDRAQLKTDPRCTLRGLGRGSGHQLVEGSCDPFDRVVLVQVVFDPRQKPADPTSALVLPCFPLNLFPTLPTTPSHLKHLPGPHTSPSPFHPHLNPLSAPSLPFYPQVQREKKVEGEGGRRDRGRGIVWEPGG
eukprot:1688568-Rhodomonas_salina.1